MLDLILDLLLQLRRLLQLGRGRCSGRSPLGFELVCQEPEGPDGGHTRVRRQRSEDHQELAGPGSEAGECLEVAAAPTTCLLNHVVMAKDVGQCWGEAQGLVA